MRNDGDRNEGRGWDDIVAPDDEERLVPAERYEKEIPSVFGPVFGSWKITGAILLAFSAFVLYWASLQG